MKKDKICTAMFNRYDFNNEGRMNKIIFKPISVNKRYLFKEIYMNAAKVEFLIGELYYNQVIKFTCKDIVNDEVIDPSIRSY